MDISFLDYTKIADELYQNQFCDESLADIQSPLVDDHSEEEIKQKWLIPLTKLIVFFLQGSDPFAKVVYIGERTNRLFSGEVSLVKKNEYFEKVIAADLEIFERHLGYLSPNVPALLKELHQPLLSTVTHRDVHITTIGDCLMTQLNTHIINFASAANIGVVASEYYTGAWGGGNHDNLPQIPPGNHLNIVAVSLFTYWGLPIHRLLMKQLWEDSISDAEAETLVNSIVAYIKAYLIKLKEGSEAVIFLHNSSGLPWLVENIHLNFFPWGMEGERNTLRMEIYTGLINNAIDDIIETEGNIFLIDERAVAAQAGRESVYADAFSSLALGDSFFHHNNFGRQVANLYMDKIKKILSMYKKKVIFIDFDNTLWQGVMAEGGVSHFYEKQKLLSNLGKRGIILVALSKNAPENIRWSELRISQQEFACIKINWQSKVENIIDACSVLNISHDQCIMLDDTCEELALVNIHLPNLLTLNATNDESWEVLALMYKYHQPAQDTINRNKLYRDNNQRQTYLNSSSENKLDTHALLSPLAITATMTKANQPEIARVCELLQRTNQFNCSGRKYSKALLQEAVECEEITIYCFSLQDKFGDMGLVGAVILRPQIGHCLIENFVMSCRAMGYGLENLMLSTILQKLSGSVVEGILVPNTKNKPAQSLYPGFGFEEREPQVWHYSPKNEAHPVPSWIAFNEVTVEPLLNV